MREFVKLKHSKDLAMTILITLVVFVSYYSNNVIFQAVALLLTVIYAMLMNKGIVKMITGKFIKR